MTADEFPCRTPGYCDELGIDMPPRLVELCTEDSPRGQKYRDMLVNQDREKREHPVVNPCFSRACIYEGPVTDFCTCGDQHKHIRVCLNDNAEWSRCVRAGSHDPDIRSCRRCPLYDNGRKKEVPNA